MNMATFYKGKRVFVTGHTGFKGIWLCRILLSMGANVTGFSLPLQGERQFYELSGNEKEMASNFGDIRDFQSISAAVQEVSPEIVLHLAAQPIVSRGFTHPKETYETNVMGTLNLLEALRNCESVASIVNVTTDKVYENREWCWAYRENESLNGHDPYSNSKSCADILTQSYEKSFFREKSVAVSTMRAGNVIGGGDFAENRIIPDCVRGTLDKQVIKIRSPPSVRPYQLVLEPVYAYLMQGWKQYGGLGDCFNIGPEEQDCVTTEELVQLFCKSWGEGAKYQIQESNLFHEANFLKLDSSKLKASYGWRPLRNIREAVEETVAWYHCYGQKSDVQTLMGSQIQQYCSEMEQILNNSST